MKTKFKTLAAVLAISLGATLSSCEKENDETVAKPRITLEELGHDNSHEAHLDDELHIEADIVAEGKISKVVVELHNEGGSGDEIEEEFTEGLTGLKNAHFHDHIEIPASFATGDYHFHMTVIDQEGQSSSVEAEVEILN